MNDREFDNVMETWANHEIASAPDLRPTAELVRLVETRRKDRSLPLLRTRWAVAGLVAAGLGVLIVLYAVLFRPAFLFDGFSTRQLAHVGLREQAGQGKGIVVSLPTPPAKGGSGKGAISFNELMLQIDRVGAPHVLAIDLRAVQSETASLTSDDSYRLLFQPSQTCILYVFQLVSAGQLVQLFPQDMYSAVENPLLAGQSVYLPTRPSWLYVEGPSGQDRLYVVASSQPLDELAEMYAQYSQADGSTSRQGYLDDLVARLDDVHWLQSRGASRWLIVLDH